MSLDQCVVKKVDLVLFTICVSLSKTFSMKNAVVMNGEWVEVICVFKHSLTLYGDNTG